MNKPLVSISCITYNHEQFIAQAIEGFLMQQTNFDFDIVISDDCSTDNTREIIQSYANKYPEKFKLTFYPKNIGSIPNFMGNIKSCTGKYIALCEGDDYWTDPLKLQMQVDYLEQNPEVVLCSTQYSILNTINSEKSESCNIFTEIFTKDNDKYEFTKDTFLSPYILQTHTVVFKNNIINESLFTYKHCGDVLLFSNLLLHGNGVSLNFNSGVYRIHTGGIFSTKSKYEQALMEYTRVTGMSMFYKRTYKSIEKLRFWCVRKFINELALKPHKTIKERFLLLQLRIKITCKI